ncbi:hypothetical protein [Piscinibacter sakaiensis]|uniref:Uncharacterized protein n=1 Tax=Piscinibacter sakaiensis TaxID=1547922 RepID=A0A0K8P877_PISS1|nr:hypothetical protein [Piscinibacter sakaiensis]GAP38837.1 hypothetical protein ISF6_5496 [Piscinibacter sakaiensis]
MQRAAAAWRRALAAGLLPALWLPAVLLTASAARAHEVSERVEQRAATVVTLRYADGEPFAGEAWELRADGAERPLLSGRTDAQGRAVLLLDGPGPWRFRAFSDDGHGLERVIDVAGPAGAASAGGVPGVVAGGAADGADRPDRASRLLFGAAVVLAVFGALQLWLRRRPPR